LDTSRAARATPAAVTHKAEEAAEEQEQGQEAAYDPVTGEINWDCPCLGGMAHGPCGTQFKAAFSCFVHSTEDPKGVDCIEKFKGMQDCFRERELDLLLYPEDC
jgi:intermembrane space import and assembly protein 40